MPSKRKSTAHIISHTHWDREWRWPVWTTRIRLVEFFKQLLSLIENKPNYRHFTLDGQSVMVEDYLEIHPEDRNRIQSLVDDRRLFIGPWYTLPDPWPISGECLIRNLLRGKRVCQPLGGALDVGYTTFGWGQPAQFPQLYAGFGIDSIITAKSVNKERAPQSEFLWKAPDGTKIFTTRLGELGRANFYKRGLLKIIHGDQFWTDEWHFDWKKAGLIVHRADEDAYFTDYHRMQSAPSYYPKFLKDAMEKVWATTSDSLSESDRFFGDGCDYTGGLENLPQLIDDANKLFDDKEFIHSSVPEYMKRLQQSIEPNKLQVVEGELRDPPVTACQGNALATRLYLKRLNRHAQTELIHVAEPLAAMAAMAGEPYPGKFLDIAWKYLLLSHSHDAINGVTVDKIADDVAYRLRQVREIADTIATDAMTGIVKQIDLGDCLPEDVLLVAFNSLPFPRREIVFTALDTPRELDIDRFRIENARGERMRIQAIDRHEHLAPVHDFQARPRPYYCDRHTFYLDTGEIPAGGYMVYRLVPETRQDRTLYFLTERIDQGSQLCDGGLSMENQYLKVSFHSDGTFDLLDKPTGRLFSDLNAFEDSGELGDYWHRTAPNHDQVISSRGFPHRIWVDRNGSLLTTICTEVKMQIPARGDHDHRRRSRELTELIVRATVTLRVGQRRVDIKVRFVNNAEDHRLRALFPTGIQADYSDAEGHFHVDRRPIALLRDDAGIGPGGMKTLPQQTFVDLSDEKGGLAFLNKGLTEFEVSEDSSRTVALTLLRTAPMMICTEFRTPTIYPHQKGGQCLGAHECEFAIYPHEGDWNKGKVYKQSQQFNVPARMLQCARHEGHLPKTGGFFGLSPDEVQLSAIKPSEDGSANRHIVRLFNPTKIDIESRLLCRPIIKRAWIGRLDEQPQREIEITGQNEIRVNIKSGRIETLILDLE